MLPVMTKEPQRRIVLWDPKASESNSNRFLAGQSNAVNMYSWNPTSGEILMIASHPLQPDQSSFKCLSWSPHHAYDDLVAAGSSSGRVQLMRLRAAVGSTSDSSNILSTPVVLNLLGRSTRSLNSLAFSPHDPNFLAIATDKARNEPGLTVWDIESTAKRLPAPRDSSLITSDSSIRSPLRGIVASEVRSDTRISFQYGIGDTITSVSFLNTPATLLVGAAAKWIRVVDMRAPTPSAGAQTIETKHNLGICLDPFDEAKFACYGDDGIIRLWDRRQLGHSMLSFSGLSGRVRPGPLSSLAFSPSRNGLLASLANNDSPVRTWGILGGHVLGSMPVDPAANIRRRTGSVSRTTNRSDRLHEREGSLQPILAYSKTTQSPRNTSSFCFVANRTNHPKTPRILTVNKTGMLQIAPIFESAHHHWSSRGDLIIACNTSFQTRHSTTPRDDSQSPAEPWDITFSDDNEEEVSPPISIEHITPQTLDEGRLGRPGPNVVEWPTIAPSNSSLSATRPSKSDRTFSPAAMRRFAVRPRSGSRTPRQSSDPDMSEQLSPYLKPLALQESDAFPKSSRSKRRSSKSRGRDISPVLSPSHGIENENLSQRALQNDISMIMQRRMMRGYGLDKALQNAAIALEDPYNGEILCEMWRTLARWMAILRVGDSSIVGGFDFSYQGLLGIWEGIRPISADEVATTHPSTPNATRPVSPTTSSLHINTDVHPSPTLPPLIVSGHRISLHTRDGSGKEGGLPALTSRRTSVQHLNFDAAIDSLNDMRSKIGTVDTLPVGMSYLALDVRTARSGRRKLALALCDWDLTKEDFVAALQRWEVEGQISRAACWAVLMKDYDVATEYLMRSKDNLHQIIAGTVTALQAQRVLDGGKPSLHQSPWIENCQRMIHRISDPYIRIMLNTLIDEPWTEILQDEAIPLNDRLGIIFRFLDDSVVTSALHRTFGNAKRSGNLEGLLFTGLTPSGIDLLQSYVDRTADVQTAAVMASYVSPGRFKDARVERWVEAYRDLLDSWSAFHFRCQFDIERGRMLQHLIQVGEILPFEWVERQILIRCNYCNKTINSQKALSEAAAPGATAATTQANRCPSCGKSLPRCVVCLMTVGVLNDSIRDAEMTNEVTLKDTLDDALIFCQTCRHGGHASHIFDWFFGESDQPHSTCPVADCDCHCAEL
ncbi:hypothetical protein FRB95_000218 [Tulasnella sp. JGI-2019a]|nr:hypothetical protein FRB95_000218 [Tulasnella sp. JGI-2019a]